MTQVSKPPGNILKLKKDKILRSGEAAADSWVYMDIMDEIQGCKANIDPKHLENAGSLPGSADSSFGSSASSSDSKQQRKSQQTTRGKA